MFPERMVRYGGKKRTREETFLENLDGTAVEGRNFPCWMHRERRKVVTLTGSGGFVKVSTCVRRNSRCFEVVDPQVRKSWAGKGRL